MVLVRVPRVTSSKAVLRVPVLKKKPVPKKAVKKVVKVKVKKRR